MTTRADARTPSLTEVLEKAWEYNEDDLWTAMPGKITAYFKENQTVEVQIMVNRLIADANGDELEEEFPILPDVPVMFPRSGKFAVTFPLAVGDFVLLVWNHRSIDEFVFSDGESPINPQRFQMHDMNDAVAIPGFFPYAKALKRNADTEDMVVGHDEGAGVTFYKEEQVHFGKKQAADSASLDSKIQIELKRLRAEVAALTAAHNAHIHLTTATVKATDVLGVLSPTVSQVPDPGSINPTLSDVVKIDK